MIQIKGDQVEVTGQCVEPLTPEGLSATVRVPLEDLHTAIFPNICASLDEKARQRDQLAEAIRKIKGALETQPDCLQLVMAVATEALTKLEGDPE